MLRRFIHGFMIMAVIASGVGLVVAAEVMILTWLNGLFGFAVAIGSLLLVACIVGGIFNAAMHPKEGE